MGRDMTAKDNSLDMIKEIYKKGIIDEYKRVIDSKGKPEEARRMFSNTQYKICSDCLENPQTPRWKIVSRKNFWGLAAEIDPVKPHKRKKIAEASKKSMFLRANAGRFRIESPPLNFSNMIDISNILERSEEEQFLELEDFFNMNNRQVFERFGVQARDEDSRKLVANCILLDSLLKDKYSELQDVFCHNHNRTNN